MARFIRREILDDGPLYRYERKAVLILRNFITCIVSKTTS